LNPVYPVNVRAEAVEYEPDLTRLKVIGPDIKQPVMSNLVGAFNVSNILAAVGACAAVIRDDPERLRHAIFDGLRDLPPIPGRMERIDEGQDFLAIVDFAHTPNALRRALEAAREMIAPDRRIIAILARGTA
jgi:UDP-N-acetylmuramoyl-L-alanyl-D-glutamate--2,6-diaminopimelate ligase